jgi:uncharacterized Zn finger protein
MKTYRATCPVCGGVDVTKDALVRWDEKRQVWDLSEVFDHTACDDCGTVGNDSIKWVDLSEAGA